MPPKFSFFEMRTRRERTEATFSDVLVDLVVQQNQALSIVDSEAFHNFMSSVSPSTPFLSRRTLERDIKMRFSAEREEWRLKLHTHIF